MQKPSRELIITLAIALAVIAGIHAWAGGEAACAVPGRRLVMKAQGSIGCFEFWFNRYQQTITAIIAALIALAALYPLFAQQRLMTVQTAVTTADIIGRRLERCIGALAKLKDEEDNLKPIGASIRSLAQNPDGAVTATVVAELQEFIEGCSRVKQCLETLKSDELLTDGIDLIVVARRDTENAVHLARAVIGLNVNSEAPAGVEARQMLRTTTNKIVELSRSIPERLEGVANYYELKQLQLTAMQRDVEIIIDRAYRRSTGHY